MVETNNECTARDQRLDGVIAEYLDAVSGG